MKTFNKKAQFQMLESIAFLIVFIILVAFVAIIYFSIISSQAQSDVDVFVDQRASRVSETIFLLPEFECATKTNCIDLFKAEAFNKTILSSDISYYYETFGDSNVVLEITYPDFLYDSITIYDSKPVNYARSRLTTFPVNVYDPDTDSLGYGLLRITYYD